MIELAAIKGGLKDLNQHPIEHSYVLGKIQISTNFVI